MSKSNGIYVYIYLFSFIKRKHKYCFSHIGRAKMVVVVGGCLAIFVYLVILKWLENKNI